ncbi:MAG: hypothetical protein OXN27_04295 [Candidatus Poribacteria bacterium]|nr:hypothetical protein [Candidatus Poribacteria bacterium]
MLRRRTDEQDSTTSVWGNYIFAGLVTLGILVVEFYTEKGWIDGVLVGVILTKCYDWITAQNAYFFPTRRPEPSTSDNQENANEK